MFDPSRIAPLGVGLEYHAAPHTPRTGPLDLPALFDYVQLQPPHLIFDPGLVHALGSARPMLHSSDLSLGSLGVPMDPEFLALTCRLLCQTQTPWFGEHISWNRFPGGDTRHFVLPFLGDEVRDTIIANARLLHQKTGLPVLLENAPRTLVVDMPGDAPEAEFMRDILTGADAGFILDIDNARATAHAKGIALQSYLDSLPLDRTVEIHVHNPIADRALFWQVLCDAPVRAITLGWSARKMPQQDLADAVQELQGRIQAKVGRSLQSTPNAVVQGKAQPQSTEDPLYRMAEGVALTLRDGCVKLTGGAAGLQLEAALETLPLLAHFATPRTLASALLQPGLEDQYAMVRAAGQLRELLRLGVLGPAHSGTDSISSTANTDSTANIAEVWSNWDSALDFFLATRTCKQTPFNSLDEMDRALTEKAHDRAQPSAYKDYNAHPFFALPNPLLELPEPAPASGFLDVLLRRRSLRNFTAEPLGARELSALLYYVWGATCVQRNALGDVFLHKTAPAGGSLQGAEVYPILMNVEGYASGVYHYSVRRHGLALLSREDPQEWMAAACGDQHWIAESAAVFLSTYNVKRLAWKYAFSRGFRAALLDTGHLGQSFALVATWLGLAPFTTAALRDELFEEKLGLDYRAEPVLMVNGVGRPAQAQWLADRPRVASGE